MGRYPKNSQTQQHNTSAEFAEIERGAFVHVGEHLAAMPGCGLYDLESAAASYLSLYLGAQGFPMRREWIERKAAKWAAWWDAKHTAARRPRPHTRYSRDQAKRGRQVAAWRKTNRTNWQALQAQLARDRGATVAEVAGELGCSRRYVFQLSKRLFPRLVVAVLVLALGGVNDPKSSALPTPEIQDIGTKEVLGSFTFDGGGDQMRPDVVETWPALPPPLGKTGDIAAIVAELSALYPHRAGELAALAS